MPKLYWRLNRKSPTETLPVLVRVGTESSVKNFQTGIGVSNIYNNIETKALDPINVVDNFAWTKSPKKSNNNITVRNDVPRAFLTEKRLLLNSNISNLASSVFAGTEGIAYALGDTTNSLFNKGIDGAPGFIKDFAGNIRSFGQNITQNSITKNILEKTKVNSEVIDAITNSVASSFESVADTYQSYQLQSQVLKPYDFLYATQNTGFQYIFPILNHDNFNSISNSFGDGNSNFIIDAVSNLGAKIDSKGILSKALDVATLLKPGVYIERAKQFSMGDGGRSINIEFPLLNTGKFDDIIENWQLIFGLVYQNRPGRVTRAIIDLPVIYEVEIPGIVYIPFAYISSLSVNFLGNRREVTIPVPVNDDDENTFSQLTTIIPDAYTVSITVEGLNPETRNFLFTNVIQSPVTVSQPTTVTPVNPPPAEGLPPLRDAPSLGTIPPLRPAPLLRRPLLL